LVVEDEGVASTVKSVVVALVYSQELSLSRKEKKPGLLI
jgi:hypothetical protein